MDKTVNKAVNKTVNHPGNIPGRKINWNEGWKFTKEKVEIKEGSSVSGSGSWEDITLPHTWNGKDGQDGGNDYYRGTCYYVKALSKSEVSCGQEVYMEFEGANSSAWLYVNGREAGCHHGGYSAWRVNITEYLEEENEILVAVDNSPNDFVYPQMADFTFYGGLYRDVSLLCVQSTRFDLDYFGGPAVEVKSVIEGKDARVDINVWLTGTEGSEILEYTILDEGEKIAFESSGSDNDNGKASMVIPHVHLWNGRKDPHLYLLEVVLKRGEEILDQREIRFGCRSFEISPQKGFILNGESYPLRGVSRHQDRPEIGNALKEEHHREDMELICEMGANTIRLAHYQHDQYFYDLCDEKGMVVWAEIPYISGHLCNGLDNSISQLRELIVQNINHPCIVVWGLSNEITMGGGSSPEIVENHKILNRLAHELDDTRKTAVAVVSMCSMDEEYLKIPDVISYNHYFGWYGGDTSMNGPFMDDFHKKYPDRPIGMSEYGCEALNWHSSQPEQGDYTEEYQAFYHEELIKQLFTRPFIWATHVWNMFDFAADARAEGGEDGMNHKGLVTFDRKYKKDAFYAYKAWLSREPFVHICGKRYRDRVEDVTRVTVYSNQPEVELYADGVLIEKKESREHFFYFDVPNEGKTRLLAKAGDCRDESILQKVNTFNGDYRMKESADVLNWFEITAPEGYFSIHDKMGDIMSSPQGNALVQELLQGMTHGDKAPGFTTDLQQDSGMMKMLSGFTLKRMLSMMGTIGQGSRLTRDQMLELNQKLNQIRKG